MSSRGALNPKDELQNYGISSNNILMFDDTVSPNLLDYMDLIEPIGPDEKKEFLPHGVAESNGRPLLYFVNESQLSIPPQEQDIKYDTLRRILACRGDRAYLARIRPGELLVTPVSLPDIRPDWQSYHAKSGDAITFFSRLAHGHFDGRGEPEDTDFVFKEMLSLLNQGANRLVNLIGPANVLSLIGRALFFRFLYDRNIVTENDTERVTPNANSLLECFDNAENAYHTSRWLDYTFNGDFLPLEDEGSRSFFDTLAEQSQSVFYHLGAIVKGYKPAGSEAYQTALDWSDFDFAHVPVGLLSQVYEAFCWRWERDEAKDTSIYYTPRRIASILVDEAFNGLPSAYDARVLDPACGAGVFLVLAFRRLYRERWREKGRPGTEEIRDILEKQITGFDISSDALKLSALGLYLTAIELDPEPIPPEKLRFKELNNRVLFNHRRPDIDPINGPVIGSIGNHVGDRFDNQFDLVLSNPPWTSLKKDYHELADKFTNISKDIIRRKNEEEMAEEYQNPDIDPDLPILWKSAEWCKPGGHIAMALPARIILKQEDIPRKARETLFKLVEVTGIINGSNLSDTEVWPRMSQPFMLFFARNNRPPESHVTHYITPRYDKVLNEKGEIRIDSKFAQMIEVDSTIDEAWLWKALTVGTTLDVDVIRKIKSAGGRPLDTYWKSDLRLENGNGYQVAAGQEQKDATFLIGLPDLNTTTKFRFEVYPKLLQIFDRKTLVRPRKREIYSAPLVLINVTPGEHREEGRALLAFSDIAYNESFNGYSAAGYDNGEILVRYLHLFAHSSIWSHYTLMTSALFGAERRKFHKGDLDHFPLIPIHELSSEQQRNITSLSILLTKENQSSVFSEIDNFFGNLFGLDALDLEVISDTLSVELPFTDVRSKACQPPLDKEIEVFRLRLEKVIQPFFNVLGKVAQVTVLEPDDPTLEKKATFCILQISDSVDDSQKADRLFHELILQLADDTGTTRIIQYLDNGLLIGILKQYRYWTPSRARLLAAEIVRQHMGIFEE